MERNHVLVPMSKEEAQRDVDGLKERVRNWLDEKKDVVEEEAYLVISSDNIDAGDEVVEKDDVDVSCVLELEIKDHKAEVVVEEIDEKFELHKVEHYVVEIDEGYILHIPYNDPFEKYLYMPMFGDCVWVNRNVQLLGFNDIDRIHDEWYEIIGKRLSELNYCARHVIALGVDDEKL